MKPPYISPFILEKPIAMTITYPVRASADGTERIIDAAGQVLGTVQIVDFINEMQRSSPAKLTEDQIKHMVDRFLSWRLPRDFSPDAGISYTRPNYPPSVDATPTGTNLFDATQVNAMVRHMVDGMEALNRKALGEPVWNDGQTMPDDLPQGHRHGHAGELNERQVDLIRRLQVRVDLIENQLRAAGKPWVEWRRE